MSNFDTIWSGFQAAQIEGGYVTNNRNPVDLRFVFDTIEDIKAAVARGNGVALYNGLLAYCVEDHSIYKFEIEFDSDLVPIKCEYKRVQYLENVSLEGNTLTFTNSLGETTPITLPEGESSGTTSNFVNSVNGVSYRNVNNTTVNIIAPVMPTSTSAYNKSLGSQYDLLFWADPNHGRDSKEVITEMTAPKWASLWDLTRPAVPDSETNVIGCAQKIYHDDGEL